MILRGLLSSPVNLAEGRTELTRDLWKFDFWVTPCVLSVCFRNLQLFTWTEFHWWLLQFYLNHRISVASFFCSVILFIDGKGRGGGDTNATPSNMSPHPCCFKCWPKGIGAIFLPPRFFLLTQKFSNQLTTWGRRSESLCNLSILSWRKCSYFLRKTFSFGPIPVLCWEVL